MATGEFDYLTTFVETLDQRNPETKAPLVPYPELTNTFFYVFILAMPIVLMNLLVSSLYELESRSGLEMDVGV